MFDDRSEQPQKKNKPGTNLELLQHWLSTTTEETIPADLQLARKYLQNLPTLITSAIDYTPLEFARRIENKLKDMLKVSDSSYHNNINELLSQLKIFSDFLERKSPAADKKADRLVAQYEEIANAREETFYALISAEVMNLPARMMDYFTQNQKLSQGASMFEKGISNYQIEWEAIKKQLPNFEGFADQYPDNKLALVLEPDLGKFLNSILENRLYLGGEVGMLAMQRLVSDYEALSLRQKAQISKFLSFNKTEFQQNANLVALKSELVKLILYAAYCKENKMPLVAWIGSARPVFSMIDDKPGEGAYLNCDDRKWSPELNRTWLLAVASMGYQIKLVEQHFPSIETAILSGNLAEFVTALAAEIRPSFAEEEKDKFMHSQYHGGEEPTATPQEIMLLMSIGCRAHKNPDGSLSLHPPTSRAQEDSLRRSSPEERRRRHHSIGPINTASPQPVRRGLFQHPGKSTDLRSDAASPDQKPSDENKKRRR